MAIGILSVFAIQLNSKNIYDSSESKGIHFYNGSWQEIISRSKNENKIIFLDISATWCGPCRKLKSNTFKDSAVSKLFNAKFINVNIDENDSKSTEIYKKYKIVQYPTLLFLDSNGNVLKRIIGYVNPSELISYANKY